MCLFSTLIEGGTTGLAVGLVGVIITMFIAAGLFLVMMAMFPGATLLITMAAMLLFVTMGMFLGAK